MTTLPPDYQQEIHALNRAVLRDRPQDILQFCANYFHRRLETQRTDARLAHSLSQTSMSSPFGSGNPFAGGVAMANPVASGMPHSSSTISQVREEDEMDTSASGAQSFGSGGAANSHNHNPFSSSNSSATGGSLFGNGGFGGFGGPFGSSFDGAGAVGSNGQGGAAAETVPANYALGRRTSVSAESMNPNASAADNWTPPQHPKSADQLARLKAAVANNFLFAPLDEDQTRLVLDALFEKQIPAKGIKVVSQGDAGDNFYVVERGTFDVHIHPSGSVQPGPEGLGPKVVSVGPGGSFGELALMYNAPRAATVVSTEGASLLWALDRITFRRILMDAAFARRRMYEAFLEEVPLLAPLTPYERAKIADALETRTFPADTTVIREGDAGEAFYLLEDGAAAVFRSDSGDRVVRTYAKGDYFGELALLEDQPRAASVVATTPVKVATLGKEGFLRLLGPVQDRMRELDPRRRPLQDDVGMGGLDGNHGANGATGRSSMVAAAAQAPGTDDVDPLSS